MSATLCGCGSGLRHVKCCGLDIAALPLASSVSHLLPLVERAVQAFAQGATAIAEQLCLDVLDLAPDRPRALAILAQIRRTQGRLDAAQALLGRIVGFDPNDLWATNELGLLLLARNRLDEAMLHARNAVRIAPDKSQAHNLLGMTLTEANHPQLGEFHYRRALTLSGARDSILLANLAWSLRQQGRLEEARTLYHESLAAAAPAPQTLHGFARLEEADRNFPAAERLLDQVAEIAPHDAPAKLTRALLYGRTGRADAALALLDELLDDGTENPLAAEEILAKGRLLDQLGRYEEAFAAFAAGKALLANTGGAQYRADEAAALAIRLKRLFTASRLRMLPRAAVRTDTAQPLFILGFPRSGTTLVEQTLSAHKRICAGDELPLIHDLVRSMPRMLNAPLAYPEALAELWMADQREGLDILRDTYLHRRRQMGLLRPGADFCTDKMPLNETHLGLIALVFPQAPLIHVIRHPLDVMVSALSTMFTHGFDCAATLESAARHYVLVMELVQHYRTEMALRYMPVRYEAIVNDQETTVRAMLDFVGVAFDPACLDFHANPRYARTASYAQVTEPLYRRSLGRYRHYRAQLAPVIPILAPTIERLGYAVD